MTIIALKTEKYRTKVIPKNILAHFSSQGDVCGCHEGNVGGDRGEGQQAG